MMPLVSNNASSNGTVAAPSSSDASDVSVTTNFSGWDWPESEWRQFQSDRLTHRRLIHSFDSSYDPSLLMYARTGRKIASANSTDSAPVAPVGYYSKIKDHLHQLAEDDGQHEPVERGAINTAVQVLNELERSNYAPPIITSNGSEAVVMLWSLGGTTYALTVTDGELGYVVRRDKKRVKLVDSIKLETFRLLDFK